MENKFDVKKSVHIRKRRLLEAIETEECENISTPVHEEPNTDQSLNVKTEDLNTTTPTETPNNSQMIIPLTMPNSIEMKLRIFEALEVVKLRAVEKLMMKVEGMLELENEIEKVRRQCAPQRKRRISSIENDEKENASVKKLRISSTPTNRKSPPIFSDSDTSDESEFVAIGPNGTMVSRAALNTINWNLSGPAVTRKILMAVFDRETLATHTLSGKQSPAFINCNKPIKNQLDPAKIVDVIHIVTTNLKISVKEVRNAITTKCADENKMFRQREKKRRSSLQDSDGSSSPKPH